MSIIPGYYTAGEAASILGVSRSQITRYVQASRLPVKRIGYQLLIPRKAVAAFTPPPKGNPNFRRGKR